MNTNDYVMLEAFENSQKERSSRSYYEPELDINGTVDELFYQARNYIDNPDTLHRIAEILVEEGRNDDAILIRAIEDKEREEDNLLYSVAQMKIDLIECGNVYFDEVDIGNDITLDVLYEPTDEMITISTLRTVKEDEEIVEYGAASTVSREDFMKMSQKDFDHKVDETIYYNLQEIGRAEIAPSHFEEEKPKQLHNDNFER